MADIFRLCLAAHAGRPAVALSVALVFAAPAAMAGPSINQFELKDLQVEPGDFQFQSQSAFSVGQPRRAVVDQGGGTFASDGNSLARERYALELEAHLTSFLRTRAGVEFEKQRFDDPPNLAAADAFGRLQLNEVSIEGVAVIIPVNTWGLGLGAIAEYNHALSAIEADTLYFGPIIEAQSGPWHGLADLQFVRYFSPLQDGVRDDKWDFAYSAQLKYVYSERFSFALEGYGTLDRIFGSGLAPAAEAIFGTHDQHRVGPVAYYTYNLGGEKLVRSLGLLGPKANDLDAGSGGSRHGRRRGREDDNGGDDDQPSATFGVGLLAGLTPGTPDLTLKWSLEVEF